MDSNRRNLLIRKRGIVKAAITRIQRHVDAFQQVSNLNIIRMSLEQLSNTYAHIIIIIISVFIYYWREIGLESPFFTQFQPKNIQ